MKFSYQLIYRKNFVLFQSTLIIIIFLCSDLNAQAKEVKSFDSEWEFNIEGSFYFTDPAFFLPVIQADNNKLHLEVRYNYEELNTISAWSGYNFTGGTEIEYSIIPMAGFLIGRVTGFAPGMELFLDYKGIELYIESEYVFDTEDKENNFFYNWTDLTYSLSKLIIFGLSAQNTRAFETESDFQPGIFTGVNIEKFNATVYYFNPGNEDRYFILSLSAGF